MKRNYGLNSYEFYGQDTWRIKPNLTLTYGLRWSLFPPPWETNGLQTSATFGQGTQFYKNVKNMKQGLGYTSEPPLSFKLGGEFYNFEKSDFSPRIAIAYSPRFGGSWLKKLFGEGDKTVIRAGFSRVYDRAGFALLNTFDQIGSAGLTTTLQNPCCTFNQTGAEDLPRITGINGLANIPVFNMPPAGIPITRFLQLPLAGGFPQTPPIGAQANLWGIDDTLKTPHAYAVDFSIGRELPGKFSIQVSYVGRFGHALLTQRDLNQPLDIVDPVSKIDYYTAASALSNLARKFAAANRACGLGGTANFYQAVITPQGATIPAGCPPANVPSVTAAMLGNTAQYWENMIGPLRAGATVFTDPFTGFVPTAGTPVNDSLMQSIFDLYYNPALSVVGDEIVGLADIDSYGGLGDNSGSGIPYFFQGPPGFSGGVGKFLNNQAFSNYGWSSIGSSAYHALQVNLKKQFSHGAQLDFNYTFSKSMDITSAASRVGFAVYGYTNVGLVGSRLANAFSPNLARAVSDFDLRHQINVNWLVDIPFGKGRAYGNSAGPMVDGFFGGWQVTGLARWTTGFPFSVDGGQRWPTDWFLTAVTQITTRPKTGVFKLQTTDPVTGKTQSFVSVFANPTAAQSDFTLPLPGGVGSRNVLHGDGYAGWDMSLGKHWSLPLEGQSIQFRWEVFNVPNLTRFNVQNSGSSALLTSVVQRPDTFGAYTSLLSQPRVMQFALRFEF